MHTLTRLLTLLICIVNSHIFCKITNYYSEEKLELHYTYPRDYVSVKQKLISNTCFVIMPFSDEEEEVYNTIERATDLCNIKCTRADRKTNSEQIMATILSSINSSYFLVVDISGLNANVLYELGVAHSLRSNNRILLLKDKETVCPTDLKGMNYFTFERGKYNKLFEHVINFIKSNNDLEDLRELLIFLNLTSDEDDVDTIVKDLDKNLESSAHTLINLLNNNLGQIDDIEVNSIFGRLHTRTFSFCETDEYHLKHFYLNLIIHLLIKLSKSFNLEQYLNLCFRNCKIEEDEFLLEVQADIATTMANIKFYSAVFEWIKKYLMYNFPSAMDITKFKLQVALLKSRLPEVEKFLVDILSENNDINAEKPVRSLVEHSLKICREKKITAAVPFAMNYVENTKNEFIFRSALDLVVELGTATQLDEVLRLTYKQQELIEKSSFLYEHIDKMNTKLATLKK